MRSKSAVIQLVALFFSLAFFIPSATAHDQLVDITPGPEAIVPAGEIVMTLTFNNELLSVPGSDNAEVIAKLKGTDEWIPAAVVVNLRELKATLTLTQSGEYLVNWKVVSSDGHPITGETSLTVQESEVSIPETIAPEPFPTEETTTVDQEQQGPDLTGFYFGLTMVILGAVFAPIGLVMRRKATKKS
jgi:methionine-rich copper-binding protein CopC